jgi:glycosyltransferase involved in cell wall biosynthesis
LAESSDILITRGVILTAYPFLAELGKPLVLDMYGPFLLEGLQRDINTDEFQKLTSYESNLEAIQSQLYAGDFFVCASEKQRDYWLGMLSAIGRVNPYTHQQDPTLYRLIDVVPFGLPRESPQHTRRVLKGVYKNIMENDKVILWGGGIWNWLDAPTVIRAMPIILQQRDDIKLFFMGVKRPNPAITSIEAVDRAIALSKELELYDRYVFFNDWVPYNDRQNYLLEADIGVSLHLDHIETRFSFRTRLLDYLWAGLPTVTTGGDVMSETMAAHGLAHLVYPGDISSVAQAILSLLDNPTWRANAATRFNQIAADYQWEVVTRPLVRFCAAPYIAPDKTYLRQRPLPLGKQGSTLHLLTKSWRALRMGGLSGFLQQSAEYLRWIKNK